MEYQTSLEIASQQTSSTLISKTIVSSDNSEQTNIFNGEIETTEQGNFGDCWLLSGVNALSYTNEGQKIIKEALQYDEDGATVDLKGIGEYYISNDEFEEAKESGNYSSGDDDMLLLELAFQEAIEDYYNDDIYFLDNTSKTLIPTNLDLNGGFSSQVFYYLTGKNYESALSYEQKNELVEKFAQIGGESYALTAGRSSDEEISIQDINGEEKEIYSTHAYAVKSADEKAITITNPHDSSEEITLSKETFLETFDTLTGIDLLSENVDLVGETTKEIIQEDDKTIENIKNEEDETIKTKKYDSEGNIENTSYYYYNSNSGNLNTVISYDSNGNLVESTGYYSNGQISIESEYGENESVSSIYDEDGNVIKQTLTNSSFTETTQNEYYKNGNLKNQKIKTENENVTVKNYSGEYYKNGNLKKEIESEYSKDGITIEVQTEKNYKKNGDLKNSKTYIYNDDGNVEKLEIDSNGDGIIDKTVTK